MATGFVQRFKGKIDTFWGGLWQGGIQSSAIFHNAGSPTNGTSGTGAGIAGKGALLIDTTNGALYQNTNTLASPTWTQIAEGSNSPTFTNLTLTGLIYNSVTTGITAGTTRTRTGAVALTTELNRVDTSTAPSAGTLLGDGVVLMASAAGLDIIVVNNTANPIQVYSAGSDTINGVAGSTGVAVSPNSVNIFVAQATGGWVCDLGFGNSGQLATQLAQDGMSANSGAVQSGATAINALISRFTTVGGNNYSAVLPASAAGLELTVINAGANAMTIWPNGATDTINGNNNASAIPYVLGVGGVVTFCCTVVGAWHTLAGAAFSPSIASGLTTVTSVANQQTATTGGVTLKNQTLAAGASWRVRAFGTYVAASSATARNFEVSAFWGSSQLTKIAVAVLASQAQTTGWDCEFLISASSGTAAWLSGRLINQVDTATSFNATQIATATAASNTGLSSGPQTIDFRVDTSASVPGDAINVQGVTIERLV